MQTKGDSNAMTTQVNEALMSEQPDTLRCCQFGNLYTVNTLILMQIMV